MKRCSNKNCTEPNPQPLDNFHRDTRRPDGHRSRCKVCELARAAQYRAKYHELRAEKQAAYYQQRGDVQRKASRDWKAKHKAEQKAYWSKWSEEHREDRADYFREYQASKPHKILEKGRRRRAHKLGAEGTFTERQFQEKLAQMGHLCFWCGKTLVKSNTTRDHYIPLSKGGSDRIENIVPACRSCNCRRRNKMPDEFIEYLRSATLSQATEGKGSVEGATTREMSPNNNSLHERPALVPDE